MNKLGYSVCGSSKNGVDTIALIKEKEPDLVLQDIELLVVLSERLSPGMKGPMDGIGVGEFLSSQTKIPFINMTSHTEDSILKRAKNTGSTGFVKKPF